MPATSDIRTRRRWRLPWLAITLLVLYPLSTGPVGIIVIRTENAALNSTAEIAYWPLSTLADRFEPVDRLLNGYMQLWSPLVPDDWLTDFEILPPDPLP